MSLHVIGKPGQEPRIIFQSNSMVPADILQAGEVTFDIPAMLYDVLISTDGKSLVPKPVTLAAAKAAKWLQVKSCRQKAIDGGCTVAGKGRYDTDAKSRLALHEASLLASRNLFTSRDWTMIDNSVLTHSALELIAASNAVGLRHDACHAKAASYRAAINACATVAAVNAIDITQDWPD